MTRKVDTSESLVTRMPPKRVMKNCAAFDCNNVLSAEIQAIFPSVSVRLLLDKFIFVLN